ncbi:hypothetical protein LguiA_028099 [Lonicera macranthoides]
MHCSTLILQHLSFIILLLSIFSFSASLSNPRNSIADIYCQLSNGDENDEFVSNYITVMKGLTNRIPTHYYANYTTKSHNNSVYGFAQCHSDLNRIECHQCFDKAKQLLDRCLPGAGGRIYLDGCFIRYDTYEFYGESINKGYDSTKCGAPTENLNDDYMQREFAEKLYQAMGKVISMAMENGGFGAAEVKSGVVTAYALGQCWNTVDKNGCNRCLKDAEEKVRKCIPGSEGRALNAGCYLRYSTQKFFDEDAVTRKYIERGFSESVIIIIAIALSFVFLLLSLFGAFVGYKRYLKRKGEKQKTDRLPSMVNKSGLHFNYEMLEQATEGFSSLNKLGQGGAGTVFKGILPDGRAIAVKRLFFNSRQWVDDFFNEVNLISGINHKNLVRLLGFSIEGPESLLVYEFVPNKSLAQLLFDKNRTQTLSWQQRFNIILGIAEGLAYLHCGCQEKIIHRDIKNSNILLDENLTPKISDFGLARCVTPNKTHISTAIAGTLGYMAPEYLVRGQLSEKTDVYAFGVLSLEISCGRKNNVFVHDLESVLHCVWKNYKSNEIKESIDSNLEGDFEEKEASTTLLVGLMCTQTNANLRPSMSQVVEMLTNKKITLPLPQQAPFNNSSFLLSDDTTKSSIMNSPSSNWHTTNTTSSSESFVSMATAKSHSLIENV